MKLAIVFPVMNQHPLASACIDIAIKNISGKNHVECVVLDNGSDTPFEYQKLTAIYPEISHKIGDSEITPSESYMNSCFTTVVRYEKSIGVYPTFWEALKHTDADILCFFHSDLVIYEKGWDQRVIDLFEENKKLGLVGFIGSTEIDGSGGRGLGTASNFMGQEIYRQHGDERMVWKGSAAEVHGKRLTTAMTGAVVDGCAMIFRRSCLETIKQRPEFPPHHFYDRLLSCETKEAGYIVGVLGIACDHISGQTVNQEPKYQEMAREWAEAHGLQTMLMFGLTNWDGVIYKEAERQWLTEYREVKHMIPFKI